MTSATDQLFRQVTQRPFDAAAALAVLNQGASLRERAHGLTPLLAAAQAGCIDACLWLLTQGADAQAVAQGDEHVLNRAKRQLLGRSAAHGAAEHQSPVLMAVLLAHGADPQCRDRGGRTPMSMLFRPGPGAPGPLTRDARACLELLLQAGASPDDLPDREPITPMRRAISRGDAATCQLLLAHGSDGHVVNEQGYTLLHLAVSCNQPDVCGVLLAHGLDPYARGGLEQSPLDADWAPLATSARNVCREFALRHDLDADLPKASERPRQRL